MDKEKWYQIQLYKKGKIEIFNNVFSHNSFTHEGDLYLNILHSGSRNTGSYQVSSRKISDCYDVKVLDDPNFDPKYDYPRNVEIVIHSRLTDELRRKEDCDV